MKKIKKTVINHDYEEYDGKELLSRPAREGALDFKNLPSLEFGKKIKKYTQNAKKAVIMQSLIGFDKSIRSKHYKE